MENDFFNQVKNEMTEYGKSLGNVGKWRLIDVVSRVLGLFLLIFTLVLCVFAVFTFCAVAAIDAMSAFMPVWAAALIMGAAYIVLILIALACRRQLFIQPFIKLLSKQITTTEELALKTMEAEHQEELQRVRLQCHVDSAMRQFDLYTGIIAAVWRYIKGLLSK